MILQRNEVDLSFADFDHGPARPYTAPDEIGGDENAAKAAGSLARREGFEPPTLRFEARCSMDLEARIVTRPERRRPATLYQADS